MSKSFQKKITYIKNIFEKLSCVESKYQYLLKLGQQLPHLPKELQTEKNLIKGCQSRVYLHTEEKNGLLFFSAATDALISAGLVFLLIQVYNGEKPETILKKQPNFMQEIGVLSSLSPSRSNGFAQMYLRLQQEAVKFLFPEKSI